MSATLSPGFSPRHDLAVIVACDANYLAYAAVAAFQLSQLRDRLGGFDVLIGAPDPLTLPPSLIAAGIGHVAARNPALEDALPLDARRSLATYMEVFLGQALRGIYRRIMVIDADIIVQSDSGADFARLLSLDLGRRAVAAIRDNRQWRSPTKRVDEFRKLGLPATPYFNAGVVMIDTETWAEQDLPARCAAFARAHLAGLGRDQALVNGVLAGDWAELSPLWNWQYTWASSFLVSMADPFIVHFIGKTKPWLAEAAGVVPYRWRAPYARLPDDIRPPLPDNITARDWPRAGDLRRGLLRQWRAAGAMTAYLDRFADAYSLATPG